MTSGQYMIERSLRQAAIAPTVLGVAVAMLSGCGISGAGSANSASAPVLASAIQGVVHGGQQPISGSTVQLYAVNTSSLGGAATAIGSPVTSDQNGNFSLSGTYNCSGASQVYAIADQGSAGAGNNTAIRASAALGSCATLLQNAASVFININELTTVAAAYALSPFAVDSKHIGAVGTNPTGLVNAFANAANLVNTATGAVGGSSLPSDAVVPTAELNSLGNILAACVNSTGAASTQCAALSSATGASNTFDAAIYIAKNPGASAVTGLFSLQAPPAQFQPSLSAQPNDFSVAIAYAASGDLSAPYGLAVDANGDVWVANASGKTVTELSPSGTVLANATAAGLAGAQAVAVDRSGNVWVANTGGNSLVKFTLTGGAISGTNVYSGVTGPTSVAIDSAGNAFATNYDANTVTGLTAGGAGISGSPFAGGGNISLPTGIAVGSDGSLYVSNLTGTVTKLSNAGSFTSTITDNALQGAVSVALDPSGNILATGSVTGTSVQGAISEFSSSGTPAFTYPLTLSLTNPAGIASDGTSIWLVNGASSGSLVQVAFGSTIASSPGNGFGSLNTPVGLAIDGSGCVWTANMGSNTVSQFVGIAVPVATPLAASAGP